MPFLVDAFRLAVVVLTGAWSRRPVRPLGDEDQRPLPGDDLVPGARARWTNAVTIRARPEQIWPWLVQMGCHRAGWYSYDGLDNDGVPSARHIVPELQRAELGDIFPWSPTVEGGFVLERIEPGRALVLGSDSGGFRVLWAFVLDRLDAKRTRLLVRASAQCEGVRAGLSLALWHPIHFAMQRRQLLNLRTRAEAAAT